MAIQVIFDEIKKKYPYLPLEFDSVSFIIT